VPVSKGDGTTEKKPPTPAFAASREAQGYEQVTTRYDPEDSDLLSSRSSASAYIDLGYASTPRKMREVRKLIEESLKYRLLVMPFYSKSIARTYYELGQISTRTGEFQRAVGYLSKALKIYRKVLEEEAKQRGEDVEKLTEPLENEETARCLSSLAVAHAEMEEHVQALELHERSLVVREAIFGRQHPETIESLNNVATSRFILNDVKKAADIFEDVVSLSISVLKGKVNSPYLALAYYNLGCAYRELDWWGQAKEALTEGLDIAERALGETHTTTNSIRETLKAGPVKRREMTMKEIFESKGLELPHVKEERVRREKEQQEKKDTGEQILSASSSASEATQTKSESQQRQDLRKSQHTAEVEVEAMMSSVRTEEASQAKSQREERREYGDMGDGPSETPKRKKEGGFSSIKFTTLGQASHERGGGG